MVVGFFFVSVRATNTLPCFQPVVFCPPVSTCLSLCHCHNPCSAILGQVFKMGSSVMLSSYTRETRVPTLQSFWADVGAEGKPCDHPVTRGLDRGPWGVPSRLCALPSSAPVTGAARTPLLAQLTRPLTGALGRKV